MEHAENIEVTLVGQPYSNLAISPNNQILVASVGSSCEVLSTDRKSDGTRRLLKHDSDVVAVFFQSNERLVTVTENGEVTEFEFVENKFQKLTSKRITAFPVLSAFARKPSSSEGEEKELELWIVIKKSENKILEVCVTGANGSIEKVLEIPSTLKKEHILISDGVVTYCQGLEITCVILSDEEDRKVVSTTTYTAKNGGGEDETRLHCFERLAANGNLILAAISDGRILQWSNMKSAGVSDTYHRIHWHKVGAQIAVTEFGNVISAGAECVLARHSKGQKAPTLLPRLMAPVTGLVLSDDSSTCALIMEDNSIHTVLLATMAIKSSLSTLEYCPRSLNTVFCSDPKHRNFIVMNGKPGCIQWFDPISVSTKSKMLVTLENTADGDMSSRGIQSAFRDALSVSITSNFIATIEKFVNFDGENHLRFWRRGAAFESGSKLIASVSIPQDVVFVATCQAQNSGNFENTIISASTSGTISVWNFGDNDVREDLERSRNWQETEITAISSIQTDGKFVSAHGQHAVLWNVKNMKIIEVLSCDDVIQSVAFAENGRHLIISTKKGVVCWDTLCLLVSWKIQQSVGIFVNQAGCFAFDGPQVMRFDEESGRVLETIQFSEAVDQLIVVKRRRQEMIYVAKTAKGILCNRPSVIAHDRGTGKPRQSDLQTPFHQLARLPTQPAQKTSTTSEFVRQPRPEAARLFSGPVHQLPPISFIAPLFIEKSLLPPPIRS